MEKINELEYIDLKQSIDSSKEEIEKCKKIIGITRIALQAFEEEIKKYPMPKLPKQNTTKL